jgi:hypothetical protein
MLQPPASMGTPDPAHLYRANADGPIYEMGKIFAPALCRSKATEVER